MAMAEDGSAAAAEKRRREAQTLVSLRCALTAVLAGLWLVAVPAGYVPYLLTGLCKDAYSRDWVLDFGNRTHCRDLNVNWPTKYDGRSYRLQNVVFGAVGIGIGAVLVLWHLLLAFRGATWLAATKSKRPAGNPLGWCAAIAAVVASALSAATCAWRASCAPPPDSPPGYRRHFMPAAFSADAGGAATHFCMTAVGLTAALTDLALAEHF